jgi:DNA-binding Lrp family transcriptional regulator
MLLAMAVAPALKPQDLYVALKYLLLAGLPTSYERVAKDLGMDAAGVYRSVQRATQAGLLRRAGQNIQAVRVALEEFIVHGARYVFYPQRGLITRGLPTAYAAAPLNAMILADQEPPPVWSSSDGDVRGLALTPLHPQAAFAAQKDPQLYQLLAIVDALRIGRARERQLASAWLHQRLKDE